MAKVECWSVCMATLTCNNGVMIYLNFQYSIVPALGFLSGLKLMQALQEIR